ncbi:cell wall protein DAN4 [Biomphalaria pfeifferi]|uniref:Cell wall protein DAN4 n=1 Tax=Biomphalaria pfeifferi TaxID=112525 RepID=A0AAD8EYY4_BIOPF|nr:cell wall protein DAN4 [Biomphalaria pfeifferi]
MAVSILYVTGRTWTMDMNGQQFVKEINVKIFSLRLDVGEITCTNVYLADRSAARMLPKDIYVVACLALVISTRFIGAIDLDFDPALRLPASRFTAPATTSTPATTTTVDKTKYSKVGVNTYLLTTQKPASNITAHSILSLIFNTNVSFTTPQTTTSENAISENNPTTTVAPSAVRATASPTTTPNTASTMTTTSVAPTTTTRNVTSTMTTTSAAPTTTTTSTKPTKTTANTEPTMTAQNTAPRTSEPSTIFIFPAPSAAPLMTTSRAPHITTPSAAHIMTTLRGARKMTTPLGAHIMTTPSTSTGFEHLQQHTTTRPIKHYNFPAYYYHPNNKKVKVYGKGDIAETTSEEDEAPNNPLAVIYIYVSIKS